MAFETENGELIRFTPEPGCSAAAVPAELTSIGSYAFSGCTALRSVTLPAGLRKISTFAFAGCTGLQSITMQPGLLHIGSHAFEGCTALRVLALPDGLTQIDVSAFQGCTNLQTVTLPESIVQLKGSAFFGCISLREIRLYPDEPGICRPEEFWRLDDLEEEICAALKMLRREHYCIWLEPAVKYPFLLMKYEHEPCMKIARYIRKRITRILTRFIENDDEDMIAALLRHEALFTPESIDTCISRALRLKRYKIYALLAACKNRCYGFENTEQYDLL